MLKYKLTEDSIIIDGRTLYRIKALRSFGTILAGDLGGHIESESNLSHKGDCWVNDRAVVYGDSRVHGDSSISGNARIYGNSNIYGRPIIYGDVEVYGDAEISGSARLYGNIQVYGLAKIGGNTRIYGSGSIYGNAWVVGNVKIGGNAEIFDHNHLVHIGPIGSRSDYTTFYRNRSGGIEVACGCFGDSIEEFEESVGKTHLGNKHEKSYRLAIELAKVQIDLT